MTPHYEAPATEGCSSVSMPQSKIEKCFEVDVKDDARISSVKVATKKREKRWHEDSSRELQLANHLLSNNVRKSAPRFSPKQKLVVDFALVPEGDEG